MHRNDDEGTRDTSHNMSSIHIAQRVRLLGPALGPNTPDAMTTLEAMVRMARRLAARRRLSGLQKGALSLVAAEIESDAMTDRPADRAARAGARRRLRERCATARRRGRGRCLGRHQLRHPASGGREFVVRMGERVTESQATQARGVTGGGGDARARVRGGRAAACLLR